MAMVRLKRQQENSLWFIRHYINITSLASGIVEKDIFVEINTNVGVSPIQGNDGIFLLITITQCLLNTSRLMAMIRHGSKST